MNNIKRIEGYNNTHGYEVQIERKKNGKRITVACKLFSDGIHGGKNNAYENAKIYCKEMTAKFPPRCLASN
ncbi:MAG: hypothetical protein KF816_11585 [Melioribacteraceae bacterium]|nr:hypothetical protein [Melioribacteraceae bacterium]